MFFAVDSIFLNGVGCSLFLSDSVIGLPSWAGRLMNLYVVIRVEKRNEAIRRRYYRLVQREKFRLAALGICQHQITAVCRWLSGSMRKPFVLPESPQLAFDFT